MIEEQDQQKSAGLALKKSMFKDIIPCKSSNTQTTKETALISVASSSVCFSVLQYLQSH